MSETTIHRVDGVGKQTTSDVPADFNPETFEQAIHGLQQLVISFARLDDRMSDDYNPNHTKTTSDEGDKQLVIEEDTMLDDVLTCIPKRWDVSVLTDLVMDNSYAVRTSVNCGGGIIVYATAFVQEGMLNSYTVGHTDLLDPDETREVSDLTKNSSARVLTHVNRFFERSVTAAYAKTIPSAATAFDYIATKADTPPTGRRPASLRDRREQLSQKEWAEIRGKTQQTVSDNVRSARKQLRDRDDLDAFTRRSPALVELDEDADDNGDIRLV
ncbi:hypothetical protein [Halopenitus persicus]|uniref:Uncharacterized protein n=1 Tax=Halopenitus persicus TaxID=1048396 RepID=A0A1H3P4K9_9EURY|nr:hypothetical protein [Halopenitus persicus]SDY95960.1 hypothetical protein SAMN05216564_11913 [Halopenitus persicus]